MQGSDFSPLYGWGRCALGFMRCFLGPVLKPRDDGYRRGGGYGRGDGYRRAALVSIFGVFLILCGCSQDDKTVNAPQTQVVEFKAQEDKPTLPLPYVETGDLKALKKHQRVRLLIPRWESNQALPRQGLPLQAYRDMAEAFVEAQGLSPQWVTVDSFEQLIPALLEGRGDIVVANLTYTEKRAEQLAFTLPLTQVEEVLITTPQAPAISSLDGLAGKNIGVVADTSFDESLQRITKEKPKLGFTVKSLQDISDPDTLLDRLNAGEFDATVLDNNIASALSAYRDDFRVGIPISELRNIAWAVRPNASELLTQLNLFITQTLTAQHRDKRYQDDLAGIKKRKTLRMITRNTPTNYFLWRGELMGFEYDLVKAFADRQKLKLEVVVAPPEADMIQWLKEGRGDLIAAAMTILPEREQQGITFTRYYNKIGEQLVTNKSRPPLTSLNDLNGRTLVLRPDTAYWHSAKIWLDQGHSFTLQAAAEDMNTDEILAEVAQGNIDATLADSHLVAIEKSFHETLAPGFIQEPLRKHGWAVRAKDTELLKALNGFLTKEYKGLFFNVTYQKYFKNQKRIDKYQGQRLGSKDALSPYDEIIKQLTTVLHLDWRLVIAQMYQESRFNPKARSFAGAQGLLQVMPRTAKEMGFPTPLSVQEGIEAGVKYLGWVRDRFEETLPLQERLWFTLAAYNAGYGHVYDARRLAVKKGWDADIWFGNVENAMLLLSKREYFRKARFGYVRGREPVNYVREIRDRYDAYLAL